MRVASRSHARLIGRYALLLLLVTAACSDDESGVPRCVPGRVETCPCPGGVTGSQLCASDGTFGECRCAPPGDTLGEVADTSPPPDTTPGPGDGATDGSDLAVIVTDATGEASDHCDPCGYGVVRGRACSPSLRVDVPNAEVTLTAVGCDGVARTYRTYTGPNGIYELPEIPCGLHQVHVESGSFSQDYAVQVVAGQLNDISGAAVKVCFSGSRVPIAVFWGQWDEQEDLLRDLGFDFTFFDYQDALFDQTPAEEIEAVQVLRDPARLADYRILFFDCGSAALRWVRSFPDIGDNLRRFVIDGGSIYASDLAWAFIEAAFPDAIDFYGPDDLPAVPQADDGPQQVEGNQDYAATVEDQALAAYLGTTTFTTRYGAGPLIAVDAAGAGTEVHVRGIVHVDLPPPSCGDQICDPSEVLICSDCSGLAPDEFVRHAGPMVLTHRPTAASGKVVFTTFHNDEQADELMKRILQYLVFRL